MIISFKTTKFGQIYIAKVEEEMTILEVKRYLEKYFKMKSENLKIFIENVVLDDLATLKQYNITEAS